MSQTLFVTSEGGLRVRRCAWIALACSLSARLPGSDPSVSATAVGVLPRGAVVHCTESKGEWVKHPDGWSLVSLGDKIFMKPCSARWQVLSPGGLRVRKEPDGEPTGVLPTSSVVTAIQILEIGPVTWLRHQTGWSMIGSDGKIFLTDHVIPPWQGAQTVSRWRVLSEGGLRIRAAPSLSATAFGVLPKESIVSVLERRDDWIRHDQGWSLIQSKGKLFLEEIKDEKEKKGSSAGDSKGSGASSGSSDSAADSKPAAGAGAGAGAGASAGPAASDAAPAGSLAGAGAGAGDSAKGSSGSSGSAVGGSDKAKSAPAPAASSAGEVTLHPD